MNFRRVELTFKLLIVYSFLLHRLHLLTAMARTAILAVALLALLAGSAIAADREGRKLKGVLPGGGLTTSLPVGIPSVE